ncbi:unannotated protein [freshwater metagenome]|uniref:Unannotated protein n=1 Tax=freshwater metagenome TaxID=449393 RepID=A0A6J6GU66_9ZZZZ
MQRQPQREVVDEIGTCLSSETIDDVVCSRAKHVAQLGHSLGREAFVDDLAQFHVIRSIETDHQLIATTRGRFIDAVVNERIGSVAIGGSISRHLLHVGVTSDYPQLLALIGGVIKTCHRVVVTKPPVVVVRNAMLVCRSLMKQRCIYECVSHKNSSKGRAAIVSVRTPRGPSCRTFVSRSELKPCVQWYRSIPRPSRAQHLLSVGLC